MKDASNRAELRFNARLASDSESGHNGETKNRNVKI